MSTLSLLADLELTGYGTGPTVLPTKLETYYRRQIETSTTLMDEEVRFMQRCHCQTLYSGFMLSGGFMVLCSCIEIMTVKSFIINGTVLVIILKIAPLKNY